VEHALDTVPCAAVLVPTRSGTTARMISRFKPSVWVAAVSREAAVCRGLAFSYGVHPILMGEEPASWSEFGREWLRLEGISGQVLMLVAGPSTRDPSGHHRIEFMRVAP
jgi:pyruvate kinase